MKTLSLVALVCIPWIHTSFALDVRGPYLTDLQSDRATIVFHTENDTESIIEYREHSSNPGQVVRKQSQKGKQHVFELEGLTSGTRYSYHIVNLTQDPKESVSRTAPSFFTTPSEPISEFSFIAYGDSRDRYAPKRHNALASNFLKYKPSFVISTGDILLGGPSSSASMLSEDWTLNFFRPLQGIIESVPYLLVVGNHDQDSPAALEGIQEAFPNLKESFHYAFRYSKTHFIVLHVANQMQEFQAQKIWFSEELEKAQDADWRIVFLHVSPFTTGKYRNYEWTLSGREDFLDACVRYKVDLVLSGHDHSYQRFHPLRATDQDSHAVVFVVTALAGTNPYPALGDEYTAKVVNKTDNFCVVDISTERLSLTAYDNRNKPFDSVTLSRNSREPGMVWRQAPLQDQIDE